jgi:hypothetical protein
LKLLQFAILLPDIRTNTRTISVTEIVIKAAAAKKSLFRVKNLAFKERFNLCAATFRTNVHFIFTARKIIPSPAMQKHILHFFFHPSHLGLMN